MMNKFLRNRVVCIGSKRRGCLCPTTLPSHHAMGYILLSLFWICCSISVVADSQNELAWSLSEEGDFNLSALEFRRMAVDATDEEGKSSYLWMAGYNYYMDKDYGRAQSMLDGAEDASVSIENAAMLLRGDIALELNDYESARFYYESVEPDSDELSQYIALRTAGSFMRSGKTEKALKSLPESAAGRRARDAIIQYREGRDKKPAVGGLLGLIPGLGYFYSGEYANGIRSMILNGIFIYGMISTAEEEQWGAFSVITFFELTWYSGSIYGGIDAAHRYNRDRLSLSLQAVDADLSLKPDPRHQTRLYLQYRF